MKKKLCLVLGSGGSRGISHIGFLEALEEEGIKPDYIAGCSMGAVVGGSYALGYSPSTLKREMLKMKPRDLLDISLGGFKKKGIFNSQKLKRQLSSILGDKTFDDLKTPFLCVAVDVKTGKIITLNEGGLEIAVRASSSVPIAFRPVEYKDYLLVDGGLLERLPIKEAKEKFKPDVTVVVDALGDLKEYGGNKNILSHGLRMVDIVDTYLTGIKYDSEGGDLLLKPRLGSMSQYKFKKLDYAYEVGYELGKKNAGEIKRLIS